MKKITFLLFLCTCFSFAQFSESFESGIPGTWTVINGGDANTWQADPPGSGSAFDGTNVAEIIFSSDAHDDYLITEQFTVTAGVSDRLTLQYRHRSNTFPEPFDILLSSSGNNAGDFSTTIAAAVTPNTSWQIGEYDLTPYLGQTVYIAFYTDTQDEWELYLDSITVDTPPSCLPPADLSVDSFTDTEANFSWTAGTSMEMAWEYALLLDTDPEPASGTGTGSTSFMASSLTPGATYTFWLRADCGGMDYSSWISTSFTTPPGPPPVNDNCSGAINLTVNTDASCGTVTAGTTENSTPSSEDSTGVSGTPNTDVWYSFTATETEHIVSLLNVVNQGGGTSTSTDMGMAVYDATGGCAGLVFEATSDPNNLNLTGLTVSTVYYVRVYGWSSSIQYNSFDICIGSIPPPPANDECSGAIGLTVNPDDLCTATAAGTTVSATESSEDSTGVSGTPNNDVWFSFEAVGSEHVVSLLNVTAVIGSSTDMGMAVYDADGGCAGLVFVDTSDPNTLNLSGLTAGTIYYVRVYGWSSSPTGTAQTNFDICIGTPPPPPANGECGTAEMVTLGINEAGPTVTGSSTNASDSGVSDPSCNSFFEGGDIWYVFTTPADLIDVTLDIASSGFSSTIAVLYDNCTDLNEVACQVEFNSAPTMVFSGLADSTTYYLRLYDFSNDDQGPISFNISATTTLSIDENSLNQFKYYPNPVNNVLSLQAQNNIQNISVINMLGQEILTVTPNTVSEEVDLSSLRSGAYFVRVTIDDITETVRILKK